ncbi:hypothetical protein BJV78DRAFT_1351387 [Lactifluus subvellereus]|nr:hypothetical protein BJV78DRAFT_1351387 [Lactifluus subvellereus]
MTACSWQPGTAYCYGDIVEYQCARYKIIQPHTSQGDRTPPACPTLWDRIPDYEPPDNKGDYHGQDRPQPTDNRKKQLEVGGGLLTAAAVIGGGDATWHAHENDKKSQEEQALTRGLLREVQAVTEEFRNASLLPTTTLSTTNSQPDPPPTLQQLAGVLSSVTEATKHMLDGTPGLRDEIRNVYQSFLSSPTTIKVLGNTPTTPNTPAPPSDTLHKEILAMKDSLATLSKTVSSLQGPAQSKPNQEPAGNGPHAPMRWVLVEGRDNIHHSALEAGRDRDDNPMYIARAHHKDGLQVGRACAVFREGSVIGYAGRAVEYNRFEVLTGDRRAIRWVPHSGRLNLQQLDARAVEGGREANGAALYIGRVEHQGGVHPAKIGEYLPAAHLTFNGTEVLIDVRIRYCEQREQL